MKIGVEILGETVINGEKVGHASPKDALLNDIVQEIGTDNLYISQITKIVLVDNTGTERDSTTSITKTDNTGASPPSVQIHGVINITATYTINAVRLYAGSKLYFETSWSKSVESGDQADITVTIQMSVSGSLSGTTTGSLSDDSGLVRNLLKALIGASREQIGFHYGVLRGVVDTTLADLVIATMSNTIDTANNKVDGDSGLVSPTTTGDASVLEFRNFGNTKMVVFSLDASVPITSETQVRIQFTFTVS